MNRIWAILLFALIAGPVFSQSIPVPDIEGRVTDQTGTLSSSEISDLEIKLGKFEKRKGAQIVVLIVPTTAEETIEEYSIRVADAWKIGRKDIDDGVIFLIAKDDRKFRFEVGRGLEAAVSDAKAKQIQTEYVVPKFKKGKFYEGVDAGIDELIRRINREPLPPPNPEEFSTFEKKEAPKQEEEYSIFPFLLLYVINPIFIFLLYKYRKEITRFVEDYQKRHPVPDNRSIWSDDSERRRRREEEEEEDNSRSRRSSGSGSSDTPKEEKVPFQGGKGGSFGGGGASSGW
ncbi:TPM domain-containing protein [Leptospira wolffii]|uniref:TPM domain-containing protein n=1 Tax=Leptospira wolffii TaxID=409998 RepID=UPI0002D9762C|nr:TPM domain-containing protein [Leptospira wolffii]EPG68260.1 PF04536 family protein [Leptospira wolffii serovar Khorat str. Khorat-H2]